MEWVVSRNIDFVPVSEQLNRIEFISTVGNISNVTKFSVNRANAIEGDLLWYSFGGLGVYSVLEVLEKVPEIEIEYDTVPNMIEKLNKIRYEHKAITNELREDENYWQSEIREKIQKHKPGKTLKFTIFVCKTIKNLEDPFPFYSTENPWRRLATEDAKNKFFILKDRKPLSKYKITDEEWLTISPRVRMLVSNIYGENYDIRGVHQNSIDLDHFIPRTFGGPGCYLQNIIPLKASENRKKNAQVPIQLFSVARKYIKFPEKTLDGKEWQILYDWDEAVRLQSKKNPPPLLKYEKENLVTLILNEINSLWDEDLQRLFFHEVVSSHYKTLENTLEKAYKNIQNKDKWRDDFIGINYKLSLQDGQTQKTHK